jgi:hypothetical protein
MENFMEGLLDPNILSLLGPSVGVFLLSIFFIRAFINYQREVMMKLVEEMREDRKQQKAELEVFKDGIEKIDRRLEILERLLDK